MALLERSLLHAQRVERLRDAREFRVRVDRRVAEQRLDRVVRRAERFAVLVCRDDAPALAVERHFDAIRHGQSIAGVSFAVASPRDSIDLDGFAELDRDRIAARDSVDVSRLRAIASGPRLELVDARLAIVVVVRCESGEADVLRVRGRETLDVAERADRGAEQRELRVRLARVVRELLEHDDVGGNGCLRVAAAHNEFRPLRQLDASDIEESAPERRGLGRARADSRRIVLIDARELALVVAGREVAVAVEDVACVARVNAAAVCAPRDPQPKVAGDARVVRQHVLPRHVVPKRVAPTAEVADARRRADVVAIAPLASVRVASVAVLLLENGDAARVLLVDDESSTDERERLEAADLLLQAFDLRVELGHLSWIERVTNFAIAVLDASEEGLQRVVVALGDGIELVIVATRAGDREAEEGRAGPSNDLVERVLPRQTLRLVVPSDLTRKEDGRGD